MQDVYSACFTSGPHGVCIQVSFLLLYSFGFNATLFIAVFVTICYRVGSNVGMRESIQGHCV